VINLLRVLPLLLILIPVFKTRSLTAVGVLAKYCQGTITPDEWMVFKPTLENAKLNPILKDIAVERIHDDLCLIRVTKLL
jgi:hypothetical protein